MDTVSTGWWRRHGWTIAILLMAFGVAFVLRTAWAYPIVERFGPLYTYAGGSDSYYHSRVMSYIVQTGHNLVYDPMLRFPIGSTNPREPLFDWMNAVLGIVFAPFFGGNSVVAGAWFLNLQPPLWAALEVFPIYLIGREVSGRRTGLIAAVVFPFLPASINSSTFGYANYLSFYTFVLLVVVYSYLRTVKAVGHRRYVENYRRPREFVGGLRAFLSGERVAVKWAVFTGVSLGALALSWQGYTYGVVVIGITLLVAMIIERIRRVDSFGLYVSTWIIGLVAFPMMAPYYLVQHEYTVFLVIPALLFFGIVGLLLPFLLMRDVPWVFSIPALVGIVGVGVLALKLLSPGQFTSIVTGQGYFVKTLIYSTVAEAQAPSIDQIVVGYGVVTFFLAFVGLALSVYLLVHHRFKRHHVGFLVYAVVSVYLPVSATKFFLVGAPIFALLSAEAIHRALDVGGYPELRRTVASLSDRGGQFAAFRKAFKARHVLVLALVVGLLLPNVWVALDAGIPGNAKGAAAQQINSTIPSWLKLNRSAPASNYLGQAGSSLDTPNQYDSAAYNWLAQQDANVPEPARPAFISWWDYGFQAIDQGQHPSVADNFQNGIDPAGQFLLSQNESLAIAILATTLLQGELKLTQQSTLPASLVSTLRGDGVNVSELTTLLDGQAQDYQTVVHNPAKYLPVNPVTLSYDNAMYLAVSYYLADHLSVAGVSKVYDDLQSFTGWSIRYGMVDSRLFPFSGQSTGIFYAPADLTGRVINSAGVPTTFYNVTILGSDGNTYPLGPLPPGVTAARYDLNWSSPFYNSMLFRIYIGYNGTDVGQSGGIPGLAGAAGGDPIEPGWMLQHFEVVYKTAYVCPGKANVPAGAACYHAVNLPGAITIANKTNGSADTGASSYFQGGETMLAYYPGQSMLGRVTLPGGVGAQNLRVTVYDGWGIPHMSAVTAADGTFSLVLPPGNDRLNITSGKFDPRAQADANLIESVPVNVSNAVGFSVAAPPITRTFSLAPGVVDGVVFFNLANNSSYIPQSDPVVPGAKFVLTGLGGAPVLTAVTDPSGTVALTDVPAQVYNVSVIYHGQTYFAPDVNVTPGLRSNVSAALTSGFLSGHTLTAKGGIFAGVTVVVTNRTGVVATGTSTSTGAFDIRQLVPGSYNATAFGAGTSLRSPTVPFTIPTVGGTAAVNLTLLDRGTVSVRLSYGGSIAPAVALRFVPQIGLVNGTDSPIQTLETSTGSTTFAVSDPTGLASASLAPGPYTVYALGTVGGQAVAGFGTVTAVAGLSLGPFPVNLSNAIPLSVSVSGPIGVSNASRTAVVAFAANGGETTGWLGSDLTGTLWLPAGNYSLLAAHGTTLSGSETLGALQTVRLTAPSGKVDLVVGTTVTTHFAVGSTTQGGGFAGTPGASVVVSSGPDGPLVRMVSGPNGSTGLLLPSVPPSSTGGYCVSVSAFGYLANDSCGWSSSALENLTFYPLPLAPVAVRLAVTGLPAGTPVNVTLTAESPTAVNRTFSGGPTFSFPLPPGRYGVGARAVIGNGTVVFLPSTVLSTTIPLGATFSNLTLVVVPEINASGLLTLPVGGNLNTTTVNLTSSLLNVSVNGTNFTQSFRATPANYTATVTATVAGIHYVNVSRVTILPNGSVTPRLVLSAPGVSVVGTLLRPVSHLLNVNSTVTLVNGDGIATTLPVANGTFRGPLPPGSYDVFVNASRPLSSPNGTFSQLWTNATNATCDFQVNATRCLVSMVGSTPTVSLSGTLERAGLPTLLSGTVRLVGPSPSTNVTVVNATLGNFSASLLPGTYFVYAQAGSGTSLAGFARLNALPGAAASTVALRPTWAVTVTVGKSNDASSVTGPVNVTVRDLAGNETVLPGLSVGSSVVLELPLGTYTINASAPGTLNGVAGTATASVRIDVVSGNLGVTLPLSVPPHPVVVGVPVGSSTATVVTGGQVSFAFSVRNTGNVPVTVHPVGAPSTWNFSFTGGNLTLGVGSAAVPDEVVITVPPGTLVSHPPVVVSFETADGTSVGSLAPPLTVKVQPSFGVLLGKTSGRGPEVGATSATVPFYLRNSGNAFEQANLSVVNAGVLASSGWSVKVTVGGNAVNARSGLVNLSAGANLSGEVNLSTTSAVFLPPGAVILSATVVNSTGTLLSSLTIPVPRATVSASSGKSVVTGPSVAAGPSGLPYWVVPLVSFVPAIALTLGLMLRRWWRTRRWVRR